MCSVHRFASITPSCAASSAGSALRLSTCHSRLYNVSAEGPNTAHRLSLILRSTAYVPFPRFHSGSALLPDASWRSLAYLVQLFSLPFIFLVTLTCPAGHHYSRP